MKIKKIYVEAARSKKFQKYTVGFEVEVTKDDNADEVTRTLQAKCRQLCNKELNVDGALD